MSKAQPIPESLRRVHELSSTEPSPVLIAAAQGRAPAIAARTKRRSRIRSIATAAGASLLVAFAFTTPGRAATSWIADLAGFGEEPTLEQPGSVPGTAVVLTSGALADGISYEVVAKKVLFGRGPDTRGPNDSRPALLCIQVDFIGISSSGEGGHCTDGTEYGIGIGAESGALYWVSRTNEARIGIPRSNDPALWVGLVEKRDVESVKVVTVRTDGETSEIPLELIDVSGPILKEIGTDSPVEILVAPLDSETVAAGRRGDLKVRAIAISETGEEVGHADIDLCPEDAPVPPEPWPESKNQPADPSAQEDASRKRLC